MFNRQSQFDPQGREVPDTRPVQVNAPRALSLHEQIQRFIRTEVSRVATNEGFETFEESEDFGEDEDEGDEFLTPYTVFQTVKEPLQGADASPPGAKDPLEEKTAPEASTPVSPAAAPQNPPGAQ